MDAAVSCKKCGRPLTPDQAAAPCPECGSLDRAVAASDHGSLKEAAAQELARRHYDVEPGLVRVYRLHSRDEAVGTEPIKLLEVNEDTVAAGVMPLRFGPAPAIGIHFPSIIVEVTPDEFQRIEAGELRLPEDWQIGSEYSRPMDAAGGS